MKNKTIRILALAVLLVAALSSCRDTSKSEQSAQSANATVAKQMIDEQLSEDILPDAPSSPILDMTSMLSAEDMKDITETIDELDSLGLAQVAVVTVNDLGGMEALDYATKLANKWGVGHKETNDGIVILVKPKTDDTPEGKGKAAIATGIGMQKLLTDDMCKRIIDEVMVPEFKKEKYGEAIEKALDKIKDILTGDKD